jgi:thioredoxin reductase
MPEVPLVPVDIAVVGGGPAGMAAALWAARHRRCVVLVDAGEHRNRWSAESHGYLGIEAAPPAKILGEARRGLERYREVDVIEGCRVVAGRAGKTGPFELELDDGQVLRAFRLILATGMRDVFPEVDGFEEYFGRSIFTCPSCDGYESQGKRVAVVGDSPEMAAFAAGLMDWAGSVTLVRESADAAILGDLARTCAELDEVTGLVVAVAGAEGEVESLQLSDGRSVPCDVVFWLMRHEQQSDLARQLGCAISDEGAVIVDDEGATSVAGVYAAGDMTPGPHLVQLAAAEGARAGITAACSLRGHSGSPMSPLPALNSEQVEAAVRPGR